MENEKILIDKLKEFTRKYYKNKVIKGILITLGLILALFLAEILLEYLNYFPSLTRIILVYFYLSASIICIGVLIINPLLKYARIAGAITLEQAAFIVGEHFNEIGDKLLNTLQLIEQKKQTPENIDLLIASIEQRIQAIKPIAFTRIINLGVNRKYLKYAIPPFVILITLLLTEPTVIIDPTGRLIHYSRKFSPPAPYRILILNKDLKAVQNEDFNLRIGIRGNVLPDEVFIKTGNSTLPMKRERPANFSYLFRALQKDIKFVLVAEEKETMEYTICVYPRPIILNFEVRLEYPEYTGKQSDELRDIGDFIVPEGTRISWNFFTRDVTNMKLRILSDSFCLKQSSPDVFAYSRKFFESVRYSVFQENEYLRKSDSLSYTIAVIKDAFPEIAVRETADTGNTGKLFFQGVIKDDYGFTKLLFVISKNKQSDSAEKPISKEEIGIDKNNTSQVYFYSLDLSSIEIKPGEMYSYYFEVWDNDGIHGPKAAKTGIMSFEIPTLEKIAEALDKNAEDGRKDLDQSLNETRNIRKSIDEIKRRMIDLNEVSFKERKKLEEVIRSNENVVQRIEDFKRNNERNLAAEKKYFETSERILEKQKQLNELADHLLTDEMKRTIQEMKALLNQMDKTKLSEIIPKIKQMDSELEQELDRNLELFKQLEFDRRLEQETSRIRKLSEEQTNLAKQTEESKLPDMQLEKKQKDIKEKFDSIQKEIDKLKERSQELVNPPNIKATDELQQAIEQELKGSEELLEKNMMKDAYKNQNRTAEQMKEMAQVLENMQVNSEEETQEEDEDAIKFLVQNINKLSFEQEELIHKANNINRNDPQYLQLIDDQEQIRKKFKTIEDTLTQIARREIGVENIIMKKVFSVNENLDLTGKAFGERAITSAMARQQYAMTNINDLALLLDEALIKMKEQSDNLKMNGGQKACKKPSKSGGRRSLNSMRQLQQEMGSRLERLKQIMSKSGNGKHPTRTEENGTNKEIARMVAEQEEIRHALQEYENEVKEQGGGEKGSMNSVMENMEKNERDILNNNITMETFNRQKKIVSRMLESEKAEEEREIEQKRESKEAKNQILSNPGTDFQYKKNTTAGKDIIIFTPAPVNLYYRNKISEYILKIGK